MTTRRITKGEIFSVGAVASALGIAMTLGTGFLAFGGVKTKVEAHDRAIEQKADKDTVKDGFDQVRGDIRRLADRIDRVLDPKR